MEIWDALRIGTTHFHLYLQEWEGQKVWLYQMSLGNFWGRGRPGFSAIYSISSPNPKSDFFDC
jgi:hypothetical protein